MRFIGSFRCSRLAIEEFRAGAPQSYTANFNLIRPQESGDEKPVGGQLMVQLTRSQLNQLEVEGEYLFEIQLTKKEPPALISHGKKEV